MLLSDVIEKLGLSVVSEGNMNADIKEGHVGDLLSEVMRDAKENSVWITHQSHQNIIAVAEVVGIKAIIIPNKGVFSKESINKAKENEITLISSIESGFDIAGKIYSLIK
jgi:hypothetical protein